MERPVAKNVFFGAEGDCHFFTDRHVELTMFHDFELFKKLMSAIVSL